MCIRRVTLTIRGNIQSIVHFIVTIVTSQFRKYHLRKLKKSRKRPPDRGYVIINDISQAMCTLPRSGPMFIYIYILHISDRVRPSLVNWTFLGHKAGQTCRLPAPPPHLHRNYDTLRDKQKGGRLLLN